MIEELTWIFGELDINELGIRHKFEEEVKRLNRFQSGMLGAKTRQAPEVLGVDIRNYAKYLLKEGSIVEKRELLGHLRSRLIYRDKRLSLLTRQ
ncbi:hypothetical protein KBA73_01225 [Patescibacteria group bacterium]|nr:hypothetical protein [Patescibacteria group bacterium]